MANTNKFSSIQIGLASPEKIREILRILLCRNGFIVKEAADAKEALLKLDSSIDFFFC